MASTLDLSLLRPVPMLLCKADGRARSSFTTSALILAEIRDAGLRTTASFCMNALSLATTMAWSRFQRHSGSVRCSVDAAAPWATQHRAGTEEMHAVCASSSFVLKALWQAYNSTSITQLSRRQLLGSYTQIGARW